MLSLISIIIAMVVTTSTVAMIVISISISITVISAMKGKIARQIKEVCLLQGMAFGPIHKSDPAKTLRHDQSTLLKEG